ncbi:MAG: Crp/Fnr family transcriptional regulator [Pseudomonadota bacterium]
MRAKPAETDSWGQRREILRSHYLFEGLEPSVLDRLTDLSVTRRLAPGETLFVKGEEGDALYGVITGRVIITVTSDTGKEVILNMQEQGDLFGEIALLDGLPRTANATTVEGSEVLTIRRRDFLPLLEREPSLSKHLIEFLCERLRWTTEIVEDAAFLDLPRRLAKRLLALATLYGEDHEDGIKIGIRLAQHDLGNMMNTSRESINKHLQEWRRAGFIAVSRGTVIVRDRAALQTIVDG